MLKNKLKITSQVELTKEEERISKIKAKRLFESGELDLIEVGTFKGLADIHRKFFEDIYDFAGKVRDVNSAKNGFSFAPRVFLEQSLDYIDKLPQTNFDEIIDKYADMNVALPFRNGNGTQRHNLKIA